MANTRKSRAIPALHTPESTIAALARVVELMLDQEDLTIQRYRILIYLASEPAHSQTMSPNHEIRVRDLGNADWRRNRCVPQGHTPATLASGE